MNRYSVYSWVDLKEVPCEKQVYHKTLVQLCNSVSKNYKAWMIQAQVYMYIMKQLFFWNIIRGSEFTLNWWVTQSKNDQTATLNYTTLNLILLNSFWILVDNLGKEHGGHAHYHQYLDQFSMDWLATFMTGLICTRWLKHITTILTQERHYLYSSICDFWSPTLPNSSA